LQIIYITDIRPLTPHEEDLTRLLPPLRREKTRQYLQQKDRLRCLAGGLLMERITQGRDVLYEKYGKPYLSEGPFFNLSHAGDYVCLAVSETSPVGIDIELHRSEDFLSLGKTAFHADEIDFLEKEPAAERFYTIWTLKECYAKMFGTGFSIEPSSFCILPDKMRLPFEREVFFKSFYVIDDYSLALCAAEPIQAEIVFISVIEEARQTASAL